MIRNGAELARTDRHAQVLGALEAGIEAAHPRTVVGDAVERDGSTLVVSGETHDLDAFARCYVLGGGNAAGHVAAALEGVLGEYVDGGVVVTDDPVETDVIEVVEGTHPLPSAANVAGTRKLLDVADRATADDLVLAVIGGGGSALVCAPVEGVSLDDYRDLTDRLLQSGATIDEINALRKHVSTLKGGRLARRLAPATTVGLVFSDVVGNRLDVVASGPIEPDGSTYETCRAVRERYDLALPESVARVVREGLDGKRRETPGAEDPIFDRVTTHVLADGRTALDAAARSLASDGYEAVVLSSRMTGEASEVGTVHVDVAAECRDAGEPFEPPVALLSGGETTVTVTGDGRGGPNQEFALSAAIGAAGTDLLVAGIDTDGIDGNGDAAGALVDGETVPPSETTRARLALRDDDAGGYLGERDRLIETGPTGTNVNDLRIVLVGAP